VQNAALLGYLPDMNKAAAYQTTALKGFRQDIVDDVEENRYFVVLMAYDFQTLWQHKQRKLLWETRFSIREPGNDFAEELGAMAQRAASYFGQDSHGLVRKPFDTKVTVGTPEVVAYGADAGK